MRHSKQLIIIFLMISFLAVYANAGDLEPPVGDPAPTMHTLEDIYNKIDSIAILEKSFPAKTGQTLCYNSTGTVIPCAGTGQDGEYQKGVLCPSPRFTDNMDGTVTDNFTNLIWLKNANPCGSVTWADSLTFCNGLADDTAGLTDGSVAGDWRLPNIRELFSLIIPGPDNPNGLSSGLPFTGSPSAAAYYSSTTRSDNTAIALGVDMSNGTVFSSDKPTSHVPVWPVRGGND